ncbi:MAG: DUF4214 domain-containing protein [Clostridiales bacterium]|nr:DUF4214 domain-containing protein [Clostridiales bacterium]
MIRKRVVASIVLAASIAAAPVHLAQKKTVRADADVAASDAICGDVALNSDNFPDPAFLVELSTYDLDSDYVLSETEIAKVSQINVESCGISDLTGIKYFTSLYSLYCSSNNLTSLDVSGMTSLEVLDCSNNVLTKLNVSGCDSLQLLLCGNNADLAELDVSGLAKLKELNFISSGVKTLNASGCSKLDQVSWGFDSCLESMDFSDCVALDEIMLSIQPLKTLDVSGCTALYTLQFYETSVETLNVDGCTALETLYVPENALTSLDVSSCTALKELRCDCNKLVSLTLPANSKTIDFINCDNNMLTDLDVSGYENLLNLFCDNNQLSSLDLTGCTNLETLYVDHNNLKTLDVSGLAHLKSLSCVFNQLISLKLSGCTLLRVLACFGNSLARINVSDSHHLIELSEKLPRLTGEYEGYQYDFYDDENDYLAFDPSTTIATTAPASVTVTFDANGGSGSMEPITGVEDDPIALPDCGFTAPAGYVFDGWDAGNPGDTIVVASDMTVKAVWKAIDYKITVTSDGNGSASASTATAIIGTEITLTATPNEGYQFKEWQVISGGVTVADNKFTVGSSDVEIKAIFEQIPTTPEPTKDPSFEDFVERLYVVALGRPSEAEGKAFWVEQVVKNGFTGADCARFFMLGAPEFLGRNLTDDEFVEVLYKTYFDRDSEPDGKAYWLGRLASGTERAVLVEEFIESVEWCNVCAGYGVKSGAQYHKATVPSKNAVKFATRLYTCCLGRDPEAEGLEYWSLALTNLDATGYQAASLFFTLPEFVGLKTTNEEYLTRLYTTFMGRDPEAEGFAYWLGLLNGGTDRVDVMKAFAGCPEFQEICNQYGIVRGEI